MSILIKHKLKFFLFLYSLNILFYSSFISHKNTPNIKPFRNGKHIYAIIEMMNFIPKEM